MHDLNSALDFFTHSAKGSTWKDHKYIKRVNGTYYYPRSLPTKVPDRIKRDKLRRLKKEGPTPSKETEYTPPSQLIKKQVGSLTNDVAVRVKKSMDVKIPFQPDQAIKTGLEIISRLEESSGGFVKKVANAIAKEWIDQDTSFVMDFMNSIKPKSKK